MPAGRTRGSNRRSGDDSSDFDDDGTVTRLRIESYKVAPPTAVARRAAGRAKPRPDPFARTPTVEYPKGLLERLCMLAAVAR
jgi:hypothetical protein